MKQSHTKHPANPPARQTPTQALSVTDWRFDQASVPVSELIACCLWEYARESQTLLTATQFTFRREVKGFSFARTPAARAAIGRVLNLPSDQRAPLYQLLAVFDGRPWCDLSPAERSQYAAMIPREVTPLRPAYLEEAQALLDANQTIPKENIERLRRAGTPASQLVGEGIKRSAISGVDALRLSSLAGRSQDDWRQGCSVIAVTVDFAHYTDKELAEEFAKVIKSARPHEFATPKRTQVFARRAGKKFRDWRTSLDRLGIMRALHAYTFADWRFPKPCKQRGEKACYFARKAALRTFHSLFPSLTQEKPIHWSTKASRSR
jgi:hypothetical protein